MFKSYHPIQNNIILNQNFDENNLNFFYIKLLFFIIVNLFIINSTDYYLKIKANRAFIKKKFSNNFINISNWTIFNNTTIDEKKRNNSTIFKNETKYIDIDNKFLIYEGNMDFSNYTTDIKAIAFYSPKFYLINFIEMKL